MRCFLLSVCTMSMTLSPGRPDSTRDVDFTEEISQSYAILLGPPSLPTAIYSINYQDTYEPTYSRIPPRVSRLILVTCGNDPYCLVNIWGSLRP
jgi:hypothetical protein